MTSEKQLTIAEQEPCCDEENGDDRLSEWYFRHAGAVENIRPIFRRKYLINGEKRVVRLAKSDVVGATEISAEKLDSNKSRDIIHNEKKQNHVSKPVDIAENC